MKVAIVHDWLVVNAGAERVLRAILDIYPEADIFSLVDFLDKKERDDVLLGKHATVSFIQYLPFAKKHFRKYLLLFPKAIETFDLGSYDLVISSSWAVAKGVRTDTKQLHISYYQARNMKYIWEEENLYFTGIKRLLKYIGINYLKRFDIQSSKNADFIITNSNFVKNWVKEKYHRASTVIYPPVDTDRFVLHEDKDDYYMTAARFVPYKKIKLIVEAFNEMPGKKLVLIGDGEEYDEIKSIAKSNIHMTGFKNSDELVPYMQHAKAFVYAAIEDFGIVPIEAMACGTPVIALGIAGTAETVIDGLYGVHFMKQTKEAIIEAVGRFEQLTFDPHLISRNAQTYSTQRFKNDIKAFVDSKLNQFQ